MWSKLTLVFEQTPLAKSIVTQEDEDEAMAAMFQAQTANWEETQEKMSQLVLRRCALPCLRSTLRSNEFRFLCPCTRPILFE